LCLVPEKSLALIVLINCDFAPAGLLAPDLALAMSGLTPPRLPKTPVSFPLGKTIAEKGVDAAVAQYRLLKADHTTSYELFPDALDGPGLSAHRPEILS
jgi:hypothetical protein